MKITLIKRLLFSLTIALLFVQCSEDDENSKSPSNQITSFTISSLNPVVSGTIEEQDHTIQLNVPSGTDVSALIPTITISDKATVAPASGASQDFTEPVIYTVTAENGSVLEYTVSVTVLESAAAKINSFIFQGLPSELEATIDEANKTVRAVISRDNDITKLTPTVVVSDLATVSPASDVEVDFSEDVVYTVTAEDGTEVKYTVSVSYEPRRGKAIISFDFNEFSPVVEGDIDEEAKTVMLVLPWNTEDLSAIVPTIEISEGATISPENGLAQNFEFDAVSYTVTAEDGSTEIYEVSIELEEAPEPIFDPLSGTTFRKGDEINITGENFSEVEVYLVSGQNSNLLSLISEEETGFSFNVPNYASFTAGIYTLSVFIRGAEYTLGELEILPPPPIITGFESSNGDKNIFFTIEGNNFINTENNVYFSKSGNRTKAYIHSESSSRIKVVFPPFLEVGEYFIVVETDGAEAISEGSINVAQQFSTTDPVITAVENLVVKKGEKLIIKGKNFGLMTRGVVVGFMDGQTATKTRTATKISSTLLELVIPDDLPSNTYTIYVQRYNEDFTYTISNHFYNIVLQD